MAKRPKRARPRGAAAKRARPKQTAHTASARRRAAASRAAKPAARSAQPRVGPGVAPGMQAVNPMLAVRDVAAALDHYERAFGFKRRLVVPGTDGTVMHAELTYRDSVIMLGPESPQERAAGGTAPRTSLYVYVPDVDRVTAQARAAGSTVTEEPKDQFWGDRTATVVDPDGHRWTLATFKKRVPPEQLRPPM